jgi:mono/diheme cytochrome c family protein
MSQAFLGEGVAMSSARWFGRIVGPSLCLTLGLVAGCAPGAGRQLDAEAAAKGELIFGRYCTSCHGGSGVGDGELAASLDDPVPDLTGLSRRYAGEFPWDAVVSSVAKGTPGHDTPDMPAWTEVFGKTEGTEASSPEEAVAMVTHFIWSIQKP